MTSVPFLDEVVEKALAPYRDSLPEEALEAMRQVLGDVLATEPLACQLVSRARPRKVPLQSGDQPTAGVSATGVPEKRGTGTEGDP